MTIRLSGVELKDAMWKRVLETADALTAGKSYSRSHSYWSEVGTNYMEVLCIVSVHENNGTSTVHLITVTWAFNAVTLKTQSLIDNHNEFWLEKIHKYDPDRSVITSNYEHYWIGDEPTAERLHDPWGLGYSGHEFKVEYLNELGTIRKTVTTHNLWHQGTIPPVFRDRLKPNARLNSVSVNLALNFDEFMKEEGA